MATKANKLLQFLSFFLVLFLLVGQLAVFQLVPNVKANPDWLTGWQYRKSHVINSASGAGTGYQVRIKAHYFSQVFSQVWDSGTIATGTASDTARNQIIDGDYLYAVSCTAQRLVIYDISNPSNPVQKSLTSLGYYGVDVRKKGNYLFVSCNNGVQVWDVSDVTSPSLNNTIFADGEYVHGMFLSGDYLYCCRHKLDKFVIVDVSDPTSPVVKGSLSGSTYFNGCHDVHVEGNYAYVTNYLSGTGEYGFVVVDVSNKDSPSVVGYAGEGHKNSHVFKVGNYCYVGSHQPDSGMRIYNVTTPSSPTCEGQYFTSEGLNFAYWIDDYDSNTLTAIARGSKKLYLIDISNPTSPFIKTSKLIDPPANVVYSGGYFYVSWAGGSTHDWHIRNYQLTTASDSGEDVYLNGKCRTDFGDIRFTDDDGVTLLDYWMEEKVDSDYAVFWVEVADDLSSSNATIYIYYGKSDATTTSNGDNTFDFFDDCSDVSTWSGDTSYASSDGDIISITRSLDTALLYQDTSLTFTNKAIYARWQLSGESDARNGKLYVKDSSGNTLLAIVVRYSANNFLTAYLSSGSLQAPYIYPDPSIPLDTWKKEYMLTQTSHTDYRILNDDYSDWGSNDEASYDHDDLSGYSNIRVGIAAEHGTAKFDYVFIRKYVSPEPSHGSWGTEEEEQQTEYSYTLWAANMTQTTMLKQLQEQFRIWIETIYPSTTMNIWREVSYTYTQTVTATETVTYLQEHIRVMQESLSPSEFISYWQEQKHVFSETALPTATLKRWLEGMHVFFETVHPSTTLSHWIEAVFRFTEPLSVSEQLQPIQAEAVFTLTQTITPSETVTYLQEQQYILTETATPTTTFEHWIEGITVFTETFTETLCQTATVHYWIEMSHTLTENFNSQTLLETAGEIVYVLTETLTETAQSEIAQELLHKMFETLKPTTVFNIAKELVETFITNIETVHAQAVLYKQIFTPTEEINTALVLAAFAAAIAIIALSLTITKKE